MCFITRYKTDNRNGIDLNQYHCDYLFCKKSNLGNVEIYEVYVSYPNLVQ